MRIDFYHLKIKIIENVLPILAERALPLGRVLVRVPDDDSASYFDRILWSYNDIGWLPHGIYGSPDAELQPILITVNDTNLNSASILFLVSDVSANVQFFNSEGFNRVLVIFSDADVPAKNNARMLWGEATKLGYERYYWKL